MLAPNPQMQPPQQQSIPPDGQQPAIPQPPAQLAPARLHDVAVVRSKKYAQARIVGIPPEEFGIARNARSLKDTDYAFHKVMTTSSKLVGQGFDKSVIDTLPSYVGMTNVEETERNTVDEFQQGSSSDINDAVRPIEITEHYCRLDYEGNGKPCLYKITTGGSGGNEVLLTKKGEIDIEPFDSIPIASMTPVIQPHRFFGRSVADLVTDIMRIKTALIRGVLDNAYMINNPRTEVSESHANANTLDDLLVARPNGIVRTKTPGGLNPFVIQPISDKIFPVIEYMDATREQRTGVTRQGQGIDANALQNQSATAVNQVFTAAQARMKLIARIFAETGIRDLFLLLHATIRKHGQQRQTVELRNKWVEVDPREWKKRDNMVVKVGLGTGDKAQQAAQMMALMGIQEKALMAGMTNLVTAKNVYNSAAKFTELTGNRDVEQYFTDPETVPAPEPKPDPEMMKLQMEAQMRTQEMQQKAQLDDRAQQQKAQIETVQAQADIATQDRKTQAEMQLAREKFEMEKQLMLIQAGLKQREMEMDLQHKQQLHDANMQQAQFGMVAAQQSHEQKMAQAAKPKAAKATA